jgi:sugar lactone lactonase YvrE
VDRSDNIYIVDDTSNRIRRVEGVTGMIDSVAGIGPSTTGHFSAVEFCCDGALAAKARFTSPRSLAFDSDGNLLFVVSGRVCRIDKRGYLKTIVGVGRDGFKGDGGLATRALIGPNAIAVDERGNLFIAEYLNNRIRRVDAKSGVITTVGGNGLPHRPPQSFK